MRKLKVLKEETRMAEKVRLPFTVGYMGRFSLLLLSLVLLFVLRPFLEGLTNIHFLMDVFFSVFFLSAMYAISRKKALFFLALIVGFPAILAHWAAYFAKTSYARLTAYLSSALFCALLTALILHHLFQGKKVTPDLIFGAICGYFMLGLMWAFLFSAMEWIRHGSFQFSGKPGDQISVLSYYSFVTLTTLGYGDVVPLSSPARTLSLLEAIMGQFYIGVLVARLVGIHVAQSLDQRPERKIMGADK